MCKELKYNGIWRHTEWLHNCITIPGIPLEYLSNVLLTAVIVALWFNKWRLCGVETGTMTMTWAITESDTYLMTGLDTCPDHLRGNGNGSWGNCFSGLVRNDIPVFQGSHSYRADVLSFSFFESLPFSLVRYLACFLIMLKSILFVVSVDGIFFFSKCLL